MQLNLLQLYSKNLQLDENVDLQSIAASCNGYVGADLEALCREAARFAYRRLLDSRNKDALILKMEDWENARAEVGPSMTRGITKEVSKVSWDDIGGLKDLKKKLQQAVEWPIKHVDAFARLGISPVRGVLLHGPPGCSKTTLAKAAANAAQASFFSLRFAVSTCTARYGWYIPIRQVVGMRTAPLAGGTVKNRSSTVDFGCQWSIEGEIDYQRSISIVDDRLREKSGRLREKNGRRRRRGKEEKETKRFLALSRA
ncbi:hypothetical protein BHE74_00015194 [Ensete ventricosum]|nr:hypothetical protein BHE74_00015194 [Ensete ventricosum]